MLLNSRHRAFKLVSTLVIAASILLTIQLSSIEQLTASSGQNIPDKQALYPEISAIEENIKQMESGRKPSFELRLSYQRLGELYYKTQNYEQSLASYQKVFGITLDEALRRKGASESLNAEKESQVIKDLEENLIQPNLRAAIGRNLIQLGRYDEAKQILSKALQHIEFQFEAQENTRSIESQSIPSSGKYNAIEENRTVYEELQELAIVNGDYEGALELSDRSRALELMVLWESAKDNSSSFKINNFDIKSIKNLAREENSVLVEYSFIGSNFLFIFVVRPDGKLFFRKVALDSFPDRIEYSGSPLQLQANRYRNYVSIVAVLIVAVIAILFIYRSVSGRKRSLYLFTTLASIVIGVILLASFDNLLSEKSVITTDKDVEYIGKEHRQPFEVSYLTQPLSIRSVSGLSSTTLTALRGSNDKITREGEDYGWPTDEGLKKYYSLLIKPIEDLLPKNSRKSVVFIPDKNILTAPFAAFRASDNSYLIDKYPIRIFSSLQALSTLRAQSQKVKSSNQEALIVGNPTMPEVSVVNPDNQNIPIEQQVKQPLEKLSDLPGTEYEATQIASLFKTKPLLGDEATEEAVLSKMPDAKFIHIATHGILDAQITLKSLDTLLSSTNSDFLQSHEVESLLREGVDVIALKPTPSEDGLLSEIEIYDKRKEISAELVVLSACDTGLGEVTNDGVIGLARPFLSAGVPSVIVSLWKLPDAPSAKLMIEFYKRLREGELDKAKALRQAILATKEEYPDPSSWGGFIQLGEAAPPQIVKKLANSETSEALMPKTLSDELLRNMKISGKTVGRENIKLNNGRYFESFSPGNFNVSDGLIHYALTDIIERTDLNDDGWEDALIIYSLNGGGTGTFFTLSAVINENGSPVEVSTAPLNGDTFAHVDVNQNGEILVRHSVWANGNSYIDEQKFLFDVDNNFLREEAALNATVVGSTGTNLKNVREWTSSDSNVLFELPVGARVEVRGNRRDLEEYLWYFIYSPDTGETGWIAGHLIELDQ